jgi:drug/metabolite transporter (DMT)-like permease
MKRVFKKQILIFSAGLCYNPDSMTKENREAKFYFTDFAMILATFIWGINLPVIKVSLREMTPLGFNGIRLTFASLCLIGIVFIIEKNIHIPRSLWKIILIQSLIGTTIYQLFFIHGLNFTTATSTSIILAMTPIFVALLSNLVKHEKLNPIAWTGILLSFIGFYFVISPNINSFKLSTNLKGDLLILGGILSWAVYTVSAKPLLEKISPLKFTAITMFIGTIFFLPFSLKSVYIFEWGKISFTAWSGLIYSGLFALAISYVIWYSSVKKIGNSKTAIYSNLQPVFAIIFAFIILKEKISFFQLIGAIIIFTGVYLTRWGDKLFLRSKIKKLLIKILP